MPTFFQDASLGGTGAAELAGSSADSSTLLDAGDTLSFNGSTTFIAMDDTVVINDAGTTSVIQASSSVNGIAVGPGTLVEYNYSLVMDDPATGLWYRVDVFAYGSNDGNKTYALSKAWDPVTKSFTTTSYAGQTLVTLDQGDVSGGTNTAGVAIPLTNVALNEFARGDGSLTLAPQNNDASGSTLAELAICFAAGTRVDTPAGPVAVETLTPGALVRTVDHGFQPVRWVGIRTFDRARLAARSGLAPVRIRAGALGQNLPTCDLTVSQQHRMLVDNRVAEHMFGARQVLVSAKHLTAFAGIDLLTDAPEVVYVHILCDAHELVSAEGCLSETLFAGEQALKSMTAPDRAKIAAILSAAGLDGKNGVLPQSARPMVSGRQARRMVIRLLKNGRKPIEAPVWTAPPPDMVTDFRPAAPGFRLTGCTGASGRTRWEHQVVPEPARLATLL